MIRISDVPAMQGQAINAPQASPVQVSAAAAMAPDRALGAVAQGIASVGEHFQGVADQAQKLENARHESEARVNMAKSEADFQLSLQADQDPASRLAKTRKFYADSESAADNPDYSPQVRESLRAAHNDWATHGMIRAGADAAQLTERRALLAGQNESSLAIQNGDLPGAHGAIDRMVSSGALLPEQGVAAKREAEQKISHNSTLKEIQTDAKGWAERNPIDKPPAGYDPQQWGQLHSYAKSQEREHTINDTNTVLDGIASNKITSETQLRELTKGLRPVVQNQLVDALRQQQSEAFRAEAATPAYQSKVIGEVNGLIADYDPRGDGYDEQSAAIESRIRTLPTEGPAGAVRQELERAFAAKRTNQQQEIKTHAEAGSAALDDAKRAGVYGKATGKVAPAMPTQQAINDGFITDKSKLLALGFDEKQAKAIVAGVGFEGVKPKSTRATPQENAFKSWWVHRANPKAAPGGLVQATAEAIVGGKTQVDYATEEEKAAAVSAAMEVNQRFGAAKLKYSQWIRLNPAATADQIETKVLELGGEETRRQLHSGRFDPKPGASSRPAAIPSETSMNSATIPAGTRITSYGSPDDSTPDSNSTAGIGAWVSDAEAARIKAGETTPNKLKAGDLAVSSDVEDQLRAAGVTPGSTIQVKTSDGTTHSGRWMDRTAKSYNGKTLTGRVDVYSPDGKNPLDGQRVVGWSIA